MKNPIHTTKAIGIDVCKNFVSVVSLEKNGHKITLVESKQLPIGKELLCGEAGEDFKSLAEAVKKFKLTTRLEHCNAGLCLCSWPELLQILKIPDSSPHASIKFIQDEIRQYAVLPLKNIQTDYCSLRGNTGSESKRVLVGACQAEPLSTATKELEKTHIDVRLIEPAIISLVRACYKKIVRPAGHKNTMFVLIRDGNASLCVFNGQNFDFIRTKKIELQNSDPAAQAIAVAEQVESVLQFYELEKISEQNDWQIFLSYCPETSKTAEIIQQLKTSINRQNIEFAAIGPEHTNIIIENGADKDFSAIAAGAAMKLLDCNDSEISINLIPDEIAEIRNSYKQLLVVMNVAAVILAVLFLYIAHLAAKSTAARNEITQKARSRAVVSIPELVRTQLDVNDQTLQTVSNINSLKTVTGNKTWHNWAYILAELSLKAPPTVQIQKLQSRNPTTVTVEGLAINYAAVNDFINRLANCKTITAAQLANTKQNMQYGNGLIDYSIVCSLVTPKIKEN